MHAASRILALAAADATIGVNAVRLLVPRFAEDPAPTAVTIYDDTRTPWVARGQVPSTETLAKITFPAVAVYVDRVDFDAGVPEFIPGGRVTRGTVKVVAHLLLRNSDTARAATDSLYLMRALIGSVLALDEPQNETLRTAAALATQLSPANSITQGRSDLFVGDAIVSGGAVMIEYPFVETVPLTTAQ